MLHVKHRHVLMNRDLEPFRRRALQQRFELREIQIVGSRDAFQAEFVFEIIGGECDSRHSARNRRRGGIREKVQMIVIANQIAIRIARAHLFQNPFLARFENARRGDEDLRAWRGGRLATARNSCDRFAIFLRIFKFAIDRLDSASQERLRVAPDCGRERSSSALGTWLESVAVAVIASAVCCSAFKCPAFRLRAQSFQTRSPTSRRRRFNSLIGSITSPSKQIFQFTELKRRAAEPAQVVRANVRCVSGCFSAFASGIAESTRTTLPDSSRAISVSGLPTQSVNFQFNRPLKLRRFTRKTLAQCRSSSGSLVFQSLSPT